MFFKKNLFLLLLCWNTFSFAQNVFFNELDHINPDLCLELVAGPDIELTDWSVALYDETGATFETISLTGVPPSSTTPTGYNIIEVDVVMLSPTNGGMSLINNTSDVIQFISYGGALTAIDGPAIGQNAENIGTQTASGNSLQLQGVGSIYDDFAWGVPGASTCGLVNNGQELIAPELPLPVELLYFNGQVIDDFVELNWATATEQNNQFFIIEKSLDGLVFNEIGRLDGAINSNELTKYVYVDNSPMSSEMYYRLVQVDTDGQKHYSELIALYFENWKEQFRVFPNPVETHLQVFIPQSSESIDIKLYDYLGKEVLQKTINSSAGEMITLDLNLLSIGQYILIIETNQRQFKEKLFKSR